MKDYTKDELLNQRWNTWQDKRKRILIDGLTTGEIKPYDEKLVNKLRDIYDGGLPASIILLSNYLSNGRCFDSAFLLSRAFFDDKETKDFKLLYAYVDSLRLNPEYMEDNEEYAKHCVLERTLLDDTKLIYDTSAGFIYNKNIWERLENPEIIKENSKDKIISAFISMKNEFPKDFEINPMAAAITIPLVESQYGKSNELYAITDDLGLKDEVELFKKKINYDKFCEDNKEEIKKLKLMINKN